MRILVLLIALLMVAPAQALEEKFVVNAQYRNGINKNFKDLGRGTVEYRGGEGRFGLTIKGSLKNPETSEIYKMRVDGEFEIKGRSIRKISQKAEMNDEAKRYEKLMTDNLPFVFLARFRNLPAGTDADEVVYKYEGREYRMRYVPVEGAVEGTIFQGELMLGKFFLEGRPGQPPSKLTKARMVGPNHLVFSLVMDTRGDAERGE
jgi:hypothetical protein